MPNLFAHFRVGGNGFFTRWSVISANLGRKSSAIADERTSIVGGYTFIDGVRTFIGDGGTFLVVLCKNILHEVQKYCPKRR